MKKETKTLLKWLKEHLNQYKIELYKNARFGNPPEEKIINESIALLDSLPEIESHLCRGGYIQDKNGTPCCHGDKVRFKFIEGWYEDNFKNRYTSVMEGILKFCQETKKFYIQFGPYNNGYDWLDWTCEGEGCEWFEKVE